MDNLIKILGVLDKPYHYLMVGLFLFGWKRFSGSEQNLYFYGGIFISIALGSFLEKISKFLMNKYKDFKEQKLEKKEYEKLKQYYITEYNDMNSSEKNIIDHCLKKKTLGYNLDPFAEREEVLHIYSLVVKGFGQNITYGKDFMMNQTCYDILRRYKNEKGKSK